MACKFQVQYLANMSESNLQIAFGVGDLFIPSSILELTWLRVTFFWKYLEAFLLGHGLLETSVDGSDA